MKDKLLVRLLLHLLLVILSRRFHYDHIQEDLVRRVRLRLAIAGYSDRRLIDGVFAVSANHEQKTIEIRSFEKNDTRAQVPRH